MSQSYKIFVNKVFLKLTEPTDPALSDASKDRVFFGKNNLMQALKTSVNLDKGKVYLAGSPEELMTSLKSVYQEVKAAGGIVINKDGAILFIFRNNVWDLPKGKIEEGEEPDIAAIREVEEEAGIKNLKLVKKAGVTYHTYQYEEVPVLKTTYWYHLYTDNPGTPKPQLEEGITETKWVRPDKILFFLENTYPNITMLLGEFLKEHKL